MLFFMLALSASLFATGPSKKSTSQKIAAYALQYTEHLEKRPVKCTYKNRTYQKSLFLYGQNTYRGTNCGKLACALVVQSVLKAARVKGFKKRMTGVWQVQQATRHWKKVTKKADVQAGDIVFWRRSNHPASKGCPGGGTCHVGISLGDGKVLENRGWSRTPGPTLGRLKKPFYKFMYARRAK